MGALRDDFPHYTYDDYKIWKGNWELIDGIAYAMALSPIFEHQDISSKISYELTDLQFLHFFNKSLPLVECPVKKQNPL